MLLAFAPQAGAAVSRKAAADKALEALGTKENDDAVIVFGTARTIRPRAVISQAGPEGGVVSPGALRSDFARKRNRRIRAAGAELRRADAFMHGGAERSWLFFEDKGPHQAFEHVGHVVLVGARTGTVRVSKETRWVPLVDGKAPPFFQSARNYESDRFRVFDRPWSPSNARSRARTRQAGAAEPRQQVADALAAEKSCALRISDTLGDFFDFGQVDKTRARLGTFFEALEKLNAGFVSRRYTTKSANTPIEEAQALIDGSGCKDLFLYTAGAAPKTGDAGIVIGMRPAPGGLIEWQVLTAADLEALVKKNAGVTFKFLFDAPYSTRMNEKLVDEPNTVLVLSSGGPRDASFTFLPEVLGPNGIQGTTGNPDQLLEFTNAILNGLEAFVRDPQEVQRWLAGRALGGPSMMSWMMARALTLSPAWMFAAPLDSLKLPVMPTPPSGDPPPPEPPPVDLGATPNRRPSGTTPAQPTNEDTPKAITLTATDPDGDPLTFTVTDLPDHGTLTGTAPNLLYTPDQDFDGTDQFTYEVSDGRGGTDTQTVQIPVTPDNDAAAVTTTSSGTAAFTEDGAPVVVDPGLTIADPDSTQLAGATVAITGGHQAGDELVFVNQNGITGSYDTGTGVLTLTGTASVANYRAALRSVRFDSTQQNPTASRTIRFTAEDGDEAGVPAERGVTISPVNDAPTIDAGDATPVTHTEGGPGTVVFPNAVVTDVDDTHLEAGFIGIATAGYVPGADRLTFTPQNGITGGWDAADGQLELSGHATVADWQAALRSIEYVNDSDDPAPTRTARILLGDGSNASNTATRQVDVTPTNDAPVGSASSGSTSYGEGAAAEAIDPGFTVADVDDTHLEGAQVSISGGPELGDDLVFVNQSGITGTYNTGTGVLTLTGHATKADYQAAIRSIAFSNTTNDDMGAARTISFVLDDGALDSAATTKTLAIAPANDGPENTLEPSASTAEDTSTPLTLSPDDPDAGDDDVKVDVGVDHGTLTLATVAGLTSVTGDGTGAISLTGSLNEVGAALSGMSYVPHPQFNGSDTLTVTTDDLGHNGSGGALSDTDTLSIDVTPVNDAPAGSASGGPRSYEEGSARTVDPLFTAGDVDDTHLESAVVTISSGREAGDQLVFVNQSGITGTYNTGTGVLTLSGHATTGDYQAAIRSVEFSNTTNDDMAPSRTISFQVNDGDLDSAVSTTTLEVFGVNDGPSMAIPGFPSTPEDTSVALAPSVLDPDAHDDDVEVELSVDHGTLTLSTVAGLTSVSGDGTDTVSLTGSLSEVNAAMNGLGYLPATDYNGPDALSFALDDLGHNGGGPGDPPDPQTLTGSFAITVSAVNDAPVNTVPSTVSATEDTTKSFLGADAVSVADVDAGSDNVKVTVSADHGDLTLDGTTAGSVDFTGTVGDVNAKLGGLQYAPDAGYSGSDTLTIVTDDLGHNGSGGAKTDTDTVALTVAGDNDAPVLTVPGAQTTNEDTAETVTPSVADVDAGGDDVKVDLSATHGTLTLATQTGLTTVSGDGTGTVSLTGTVSEVNNALTNLLYMPASNYHGGDSIGLAVTDLGHNGGGGAKTDSDTIGVTVTSINDAPLNTVPGGQTSNEDTAKTFSAATKLSVADVDAGSDDVEVTLDVDHGVLKLSTISGLTFSTGDGSDDAMMVFTGPLSAVNTALDGLKYTPDLNYNGSDTLTMYTRDLGHNGTDGIKDDSDTVALTVAAVNDAPVNSVPGAKTINEDTPLTLSGGNAPSVSDVDAGGTDVKVTFAAAHGSLTVASTSGLTSLTGDGSGSVEIVGSITEVDAALDGLQYAPVAHYNGGDTLTMTTSDLGHTGPTTETDTDTIGITIDPVNDAPVATADSRLLTEDTPVSTSVVAGVLTNDSDVEGSTLTAVLVTGPPNASSFTLDSDGSFDYTPNADFNGADSFTYKANDGTADSNTVTVNLTVAAVNDAPVNSVPGTQTINEDSNLVLSGGNAPTIADVDAGSSNMKVTLTVGNGTLTLGGTTGLSVTGDGTGTITASGSRADLNTALAGLTYNPAGNFNGADTITLKSEDNGNTGSGGNNSDTDTITVNVVGQNDGPVNSVPPTQSAIEDTPHTFSTAEGNKLSFDDADADPGDLTVTITTTNGTSKLSGIAGLTSVTGDGTNSIVATGPAGALKTALDGLIFTPTSNFFGAASVKLHTSDNGNNGAGGPLTDEDTVLINVASINDGPVAFSPDTQNTNEDTQLTFSPVPTVTDVDSGGDDLHVSLSVSNGKLTLATTLGITSFDQGDGSDDGLITFNAPLSAVNSALNGLKYTPDTDFVGDEGFTLYVDDQGHNGNGGVGMSTDNTTIVVAAVNDPPELDLNGAGGGTSTNPTFLEVVTHDNNVVLAPTATVTDVDDTHMESATVTLTNRPDGGAESLSVNTTGTSITASPYNPSDGTITLTGHDTKAHYAQVLQSVSYANTASIPNSADRSVTFVVNDGTADSNLATSTVKVVPLNTPPIVDLDTANAGSFDSEATFVEDSPAVNVAPSPDIQDADAFDTHMESATITLTNRPDGTNESLSTNDAGTSGITVTPYDPNTGVLLLSGHGTIADYETLISRVNYDNVSDNPNETDRDITVVVNDGQASSTTRHATVHVDRHNDSIVNAVPGGQATDEDVSITFSNGNSNEISIADPDAGSGTVKVTVSALHGSLGAVMPSGGGISGSGTHSLELTGTVSAVNASLDGLTYTPDANWDSTDTITVLGDDQGNTGGSATTDSDTIAVTLNAQNDAPRNTVPGSQTVNEDTALPFSSANGNRISIADVDAGGNPVKVKLTVTDGTLKMTTLTGLSFTVGDGADDATMTFTGTIAAINDALDTLSYKGNLNENGLDSLEIVTNDQGNSGAGVALSDTDNVQISVTPVNDAPSATNDSRATDEDTQLNVVAPGVLSNDTDVDGDSLTAIEVTDPPNGDVTVNANGSFTYNPDPNFNGADSFTYKANDGTADSNTATVNLTVNAVNDAPQNTVPGAQNTVLEDTAFTFSSGNGNQLSTADVDAGSNLVKVTLAALHGKLTLSGTSGLSFACGDCAGTGTNDTTMTFTGMLTNVNSALNGLQYVSILNYNGPDQLTLTVNDQGNTPAPAKQDSDTVDLTVNPVNDAPTADAETFGGAGSLDDQAIGNTTMQVDDNNAAGDDNKSAPTNPHTEIQGDILAGDDDVDGPGPLVVQSAGSDAGATNGKTADDGTVSIEADGDFVYQPKASTSCDNGTDTFNYKISDQNSTPPGPTPGTAIGQVTIHLEGCVWYVNNNASGSGTSTAPFHSLGSAESASGTNHTVFVFDGDNSASGYDGTEPTVPANTPGYVMNPGERLIGEHEGLRVDADQGGSMAEDILHPANGGAHPTITASGGQDVVDLANANEIRGLNIDPQSTGGGIFGTAGDVGAVIDDVNIVEGVGTTGAGPGVELLNINAGSTTVFTNFTVDNDATGVLLNNARTVDFGGDTGVVTLNSNGGPALAASAGSGSTNMNVSHFDSIVVTNSNNGGVDMDGTTGTTVLGDGTGTDLNLTTTSGAEPALDLNNAGTVTVDSGGTDELHATGGPAIDVTGMSATNPSFDFEDVDSTSSTTDGINLDDLGTGTFAAGVGSAITGAGGIAFDLNGGSGLVDYDGSIANGEGTAVEVSGRGAGANSVNLDGPITDSGDSDGTNDASSAGIRVFSNTGGTTNITHATKTLNMDEDDALSFETSNGHTLTISGNNLDIDTTSGNGLEATDSGTLSVQGTGNTIDSTALASTNRGLNISDTDIASTDATFRRISTTGGANGIRLNNTGTVGNLAVTGNGGSCGGDPVSTSACDGGIIQSTTGSDDSGSTPAGTGVMLNNTRDVALTRMHIHDHTNYGIKGTNVQSFTLTNSVVNATASASATNGTNVNAPFTDSSVQFRDLTGSASLTNSDISDGFTHGVDIQNDSGSLDRVTFDNTTVAGVQANGGSAVLLEDLAPATAFKVTVTNDSDFTAASGNLFFYQHGGTGQGDVVLSNNDFINTIPAAQQAGGGGGVNISNGASNGVAGGGPLTVNIDNNDFQGANGAALFLLKTAGPVAAQQTATVTNNRIGAAGVADSGSAEGDGLKIQNAGNCQGAGGCTSGGFLNATVTGNTIQQYDETGFDVWAGSGILTNSGTTNVTFTGNTIQNPGASTEQKFGIGLNIGTGGSGSDDAQTFCGDIKNNTIHASGRDANPSSGVGDPVTGNLNLDFNIRSRGDSTLRLPGLTGNLTDTANIRNFFSGQNNIGGSPDGLVRRDSTASYSGTGTSCP